MSTAADQRSRFLGAVLLGVGTAMVYPTLLAAVGDVAHSGWWARAVGVYRLWRDGGFAVGALLAGIVADLKGHPLRGLGGRRAHRRLRPPRLGPHVRNHPRVDPGASPTAPRPQAPAPKGHGRS
jgi:hypothetical protein